MSSPRWVANTAALAATVGVAGVCWVVAEQQMNGMPMSAAPPLGSLTCFAGLWTTMMAAMMLPGVTPAALQIANSGRFHDVPRFVGSYLAVWTLLGGAVYALYRPPGPVTAGAIVIVAGIYELTPLKRRFRRLCRENIRSGFAFGAYCVGSSAGLMAIVVAASIMNIPCMMAITILTAAQKILPAKAAVDVPLALAIVAFGIFIALAPSSGSGSMPPM